MARTWVISSYSSSGLERKASAPSSMALTRLSRSLRSAVRKMTGIEASSSSAFRRLQTSKPSMPGMTMSSRITSGSSLRASSMPRWPFRAVNTTHPGSASWTTAFSVVRLSLLSSMASSFRVGVSIELIFPHKILDPLKRGRLNPVRMQGPRLPPLQGEGWGGDGGSSALSFPSLNAVQITSTTASVSCNT